MPSTCWTIALNANRNTRSVVVIRDSEDLEQAIIKAANSKLRLPKKAQLRVFVETTGQELLNAQSWSDILSSASHPANNMLLISAGEDFVGTVSQSKTHQNTEVPVVNLAEASYIEDAALRQLRITAETLPGIIHAVGQPDLHPGNKYPIGAVFVSHGWVHPPLIGSDIGCGMAWYKLSVDASAVAADKGKKIAERLTGLEGAWATEADRTEWLGWECDEARQWSSSLGTIGAGNHFAEVQVVGEVADPACQLQAGDVVLLVHSGSRGYGGDVLKRYSEATSLKDDSDEARRYLEEHRCASEWAVANRDLIALRFLQVLEPRHAGFVDDIPSAELRQLVQSRKVVDISHNGVQPMQWEDGRKVWIHRKGAAPTHDPRTTGLLDLLPLPGSRATPTAVLKPIEMAPGRNAQSVAHGAGRAMTRAKALQSLSSKYNGDITRVLVPQRGEGTWVVCEDKELVWEEAPEAYKDVRAVASDLENAGLVQVLGWCQPCVSYKVRR